ncbi:MAG: M28 family peptidase [Anaerolineae bacterium]|nr:M28 family metallopeptidase [Thermoflexales bacterium]MDW8407231.1 M28 family peptidase [Anaerolineae bacterium]
MIDPTLLQLISAERLKRDLFYLSNHPLPFRKVNYTRPGQTIDSLAETDAYIRGQLEACAYTPVSTVHRVQAFRCDESKPIHHWYAAPHPDDPWHEAANIEVARAGQAQPDEIIQLIAHKDSMSWIDSPGAHDNCAGLVVNLELARVIAALAPLRTIRFLFCNEEHTPWTSRFAAEAAAARGDKIIAVMNVDSVDGKSDEDMAAGRLTHCVTYSTEEGRPLAEFAAACATRYDLGLEVNVCFKAPINDDDGMFINAGFRRTIMHIGSWPYADSQYHLAGDVPERVNIDNLRRSAQLLLCLILEIDAGGIAAFEDGI